jgi:hypothetical protein
MKKRDMKKKEVIWDIIFKVEKIIMIYNYKNIYII